MAQSIATGKQAPNLIFTGAPHCKTHDEDIETAFVDLELPESVTQLSARFTDFENGLRQLQRLNREMRHRLRKF